MFELGEKWTLSISCCLKKPYEDGSGVMHIRKKLSEGQCVSRKDSKGYLRMIGEF